MGAVIKNHSTDLTLNGFLPKTTPGVSKKEALKIIRSKWLRGEVQKFDKKLASILNTSPEKASVIREEWQDLGFLQFNERGLLCWNDRKIQGVF